ncbi:DUF433 domain-containing protein [Halapricum hydrolyticum]|uniref:DUF433 domain-containing protein n=1 Tax=Halapricum hydrolyticum TaxID=2979991 RepID=A0AAE3LHK8_9EURY|nr:DUF433 domain-containing protein [Halapricum hydrolyticum]MCU4716991.1 DUF433 domain-containing protein [Halapricum hydrolyticum]MCU4725403.1 DUF433 domain-containing protein [Halapricum hydrolyticum]
MSQQTARIAHDLLDEPHIKGRRIPVLTIVERVEGRGLEPKTVADRHDLDVAEVYAALLYYHEQPREFEELRRERDELMDEIEADIDRPEDVSPPN